MSTETEDHRPENLRARIDALEARAKAAGSNTDKSMQDRLDALRRQEASIRGGAREAHHAKTARATGHADPTDDEYLYLETRIGETEQALAAGMAEGGKRLNRGPRPK